MKTRTPSRTAATSIGRRDSAFGGRRGGLVLGGAAAALASVPVLAQPVDPSVTHGSATIESSGSTTTITTSDRAIIESSSFDIPGGYTVIFDQPGASSRVLNRITGGSPTEIMGTLRANGQVFFVNPAGVFFGQGSVLDVGGLYAAAGSMSDADFLNGVNRFTNLTGEVVNRGTITSGSGIHFAGARVANFGTLIARAGTVTLSAGEDVLIGERDGRVFARVEGGAAPGGGLATGVENAGTIDAERAVLGVGDHFALALYDTSEIYAASVELEGGVGSFADVRGVIDASAGAGAIGGDIRVSTELISLEGADLDASGGAGGGSILIGGRDSVADRVYIGPDASLRADATVDGDGGEVIVYADGATSYWGSLSARGAGSGAGGFAEVSARGNLSVNGGFDLSGPAGNGELLLDPDFIEIVADGTATAEPASPGSVLFGDPGESGGLTQFEESTLEQLLDDQSIGTLTLQANSDITFQSGVTIDTFNVFDADSITANLRLEAGRSILLLENVVIDLPTGNFTAIANSQNPSVSGRAAGEGSFSMSDNASIATRAGSIGIEVQSSSLAQDGFIFLGDLTAQGAGAGQGAIFVVNRGDGGGIFATRNMDGIGDPTLTADDRVILASLGDPASLDPLDLGAIGTLDGIILTDGPLKIDAPSVTLRSDSSVPAVDLLQNDVTIESVDALDAFGGILAGVDMRGIEFQTGVVNASLGPNPFFGAAFEINIPGTLTIADGAGIVATGQNMSGSGIDVIDIAAAGLELGAGSELSVTGTGDAMNIAIAAPVTVGGGSTVSADNGSVTIDGAVADSAGSAAGTLAIDGQDGVTLTGDVDLTSGAGQQSVDIDAAGGDVSVQNITTETALTLDSGGVLDAGDLTTTASVPAAVIAVTGQGDTTVGDVSAQSSASLGSNAGAVAAGDVEARNGAVTIDAATTVTTGDLASADDAAVGTPGGVTVTAGGDIAVGETAADADGVSSANGAISITSTGGAATIDGAADAVGGGVAVTASNDVSAGDVTASDAVALTSATGSVTAGGVTGSGGPVTISAATDATAGDVVSGTNATIGAGTGAVSVGGVTAQDGGIAMTSGTTTTTGDLSSQDAGGDGTLGGVTVTAGGDATIGETAVDPDGVSAAQGDVSITSNTGLVSIDGTTVASNGGVILTAETDLTSGDVTAQTDAELRTSTGSIASGDVTATAGNVDIDAETDLTAGEVAAGGSATLNAENGSAMSGGVTASGGAVDIDAAVDAMVGDVLAGTSAEIDAATGGVTAGNVDAQDGTIAITSGTTTTTGDLASADAGDDGTPDGVAVTAGGDVSVGETAVDADGISADFGSISIVSSGGSVTINGSTVSGNSGGPGVAGPVTIGGAVDVTSGDVTTDSSVTIDAGTGMASVGNVNAGTTAAITAATDVMAGDVLANGDATISAGTGSVMAGDVTASSGTADIDAEIDAMLGDVLAGTSAEIDAATGGVTAGNVDAQDGTIAITSGTTTTTGDLASADAGGDGTPGGVTVTAGGDATIGETAVDPDGVSAARGDVSIVSSGGSVAVSGSVAADTGAVGLDAQSGSLFVTADGTGAGAGSDISAPAGDVTLSATQELKAGVVTSGGNVDIDGETGVELAGLTTTDNASTSAVDAAMGQVVIDDFSLRTGTNTFTGNSTAAGDPSVVLGGGVLDGVAGPAEEIVQLDIDGGAEGTSLSGDITSNGPSGLTVTGDLLVPAGADVSITVADSSSTANSAGDAAFGDVILGADPGVNPTGELAVNTDDGLITIGDVTVANEAGAMGDPAGTGVLELNADTDATPVAGQTSTIEIGSIGSLATPLGTVSLDPGLIRFNGTEYVAVDFTAVADAFEATNTTAPVFGSGMLSSTLTLDGPTFTSAATTGDLIFETMAGGTILLPGEIGSRMTPLDVNVLISQGDTTLSSLISTSQILQISGPSVLRADTELLADIVFITETIDSGAAMPSALAIEAMTGTQTTAALGSIDPLASFTHNTEMSPSLLALGGDVTAIDGFTQFGDTLISGDVTVETTGTIADSSIVFDGLIDGDGAAGADDLTLITARTGGGLVDGPTPPGGGDPEQQPDGDFPRINLVGDVGSNDPLGELNLNFDPGAGVDGRPTPPVSATVVLGDAQDFADGNSQPVFNINVSEFNAGLRETIVSVGPLAITASSSARLGDLAANGALDLLSPSVTLLAREPGLTYRPTTGEIVDNNGTDIVADGPINFGTVTSVVSVGGELDSIEFALPGGDPNVFGPAAPFFSKSTIEPLAPLLLFEDGMAFVIVDPRAEGISSTNTSETIAGALQGGGAAPPPDALAGLSAVQLQLLRAIGINPRVPSETQPLGAFTPSAGTSEPNPSALAESEVFLDLPAPEQGPQVSIPRLEEASVDRVVNLVRRIFLPADLADPEAPLPEDVEPLIQRVSDDQIKTAIGDALDAYRDQRGGQDFDAAGFVRYLARSESGTAEARSYVESLRGLIAQAEALGLSGAELELVRETVAERVAPESLGPDRMQRVLAADTVAVGLLVRR